MTDQQVDAGMQEWLAPHQRIVVEMQKRQECRFFVTWLLEVAADAKAAIEPEGQAIIHVSQQRVVAQ